jgi:hypothetical protein
MGLLMEKEDEAIRERPAPDATPGPEKDEHGYYRGCACNLAQPRAGSATEYNPDDWLDDAAPA